jgi:hypothetical protein
MPKKDKVVDVKYECWRTRGGVVSVEADPVVEIPNEEQPVPGGWRKLQPAEPAEPEANAEPVAIAEPKKKSTTGTIREAEEAGARGSRRRRCLNLRSPSWRLFRLRLLLRKLVKGAEAAGEDRGVTGRCKKGRKKLDAIRHPEVFPPSGLPSNNPPAEAVQTAEEANATVLLPVA